MKKTKKELTKLISAYKGKYKAKDIKKPESSHRNDKDLCLVIKFVFHTMSHWQIDILITSKIAQSEAAL